MRPRPLHLSFLLLLITIGGALAIRFSPIELPQYFVKYCLATLWAMMLYWGISTILPTARLFVTTSLTGLLATLIEVLKLYHSAYFDSFRDSLPFVLTQGHIFAQWDILVYWMAIYIAASVDAGARPHVKPFNW